MDTPVENFDMPEEKDIPTWIDNLVEFIKSLDCEKSPATCYFFYGGQEDSFKGFLSKPKDT